MKISLPSLELLASLTGVKRTSRTFAVLEAVLVTGLTYREAAEPLGVSYVAAHKYVARWRKRTYTRRAELLEALEAKAAAEWKKRQLDQALYVVEQDPQAEELTAHAEVRCLLSCMRGHQPHDPPTPTYDENGRKVGSGSELVDVGLYADALAARNERRSASVVWVRYPVPKGARVGPVRG